MRTAGTTLQANESFPTRDSNCRLVHFSFQESAAALVDLTPCVPLDILAVIVSVSMTMPKNVIFSGLLGMLMR